jgi:hypothetical protein
MPKKPLPKIEINTTEFALECDGNEFSVSDKRDRDNWPVIITPSYRPKTSIKAFYSWVATNATMIQSTLGYRFTDLCHDLKKAGIGYHFYCSMD